MMLFKSNVIIFGLIKKKIKLSKSRFFKDLLFLVQIVD